MKKIRKLIAGMLTAVLLVSAGVVLLDANAPPASVDAASVNNEFNLSASSKGGNLTFEATSVAQGFNSTVLSYDGSKVFEVERIKWSGRSDSESIVMVLMGDGFLANQQGTWPNPAAGTFSYQAKMGVDLMMTVHPFDLFADLFTVYAVKVVSNASGVSRNTGFHDEYYVKNYFGSCVYSNGLGIQWAGYDKPYEEPLNRNLYGGTWEARRLAGEVVVGGLANINMIQVIANYNTSTGRSYAEEYYLTEPVLGVAVSGTGDSARRSFVHEFGHSFGSLSDECSNLDGRQAPNMTTEENPIIRWDHWIEHGEIKNKNNEVIRPAITVHWSQATPSEKGNAYATPTSYNCFMT